MLTQAQLPTEESLRNNFIKTIEEVVTRNGADDAVFVALPALSATELLIINNTGVEIDAKRSNGDKFLTIGNTITYNFDGISNCNQILVRRTDHNGTKPPVTVQFEYK